MSNYTLLSKSKAFAEIHVEEWTPKGTPIAVIQIAHGVTEHIGRYEEMASFFNERGFIVVGNDHLGHGKSNGTFSEEGAWKWAAQDVAQVAETTMAKYPGLPYFIMGFSLGSFLVRTMLIDRPDLEFTGAIIAGTGQQSCIATKLGLMLASSEAKKYGNNARTEKVDELTFGTYNKRFAPAKTKADWLCANEEELDAYIADPLVADGFTAGLFRELLTGMAYTASMRRMRKMNKKIPIFFISGESDPVGDFSNGVCKANACFEKVGMEDITVRFYKGMRHDIFHEKGNIHVFNEMNTWMRNYFFNK